MSSVHPHTSTLAKLRDAVRALSEARDEPHWRELVEDSGRQSIGGHCAVRLRNAAATSLSEAVAVDGETGADSTTAAVLDDLCMESVRHARTVVSATPHFSRRLHASSGAAARDIHSHEPAPTTPSTFLCVPLILEGVAVGVLVVTRGGPHAEAFDSDDRAAAELLAATAVIALARLRERAQAAETARELESFTHSVAHDFRAPLRAIDGFSQLLEEEVQGSPLQADVRRWVSVVRNNARRMGRLIDDLLAYSRITRKPLLVRACDMNALTRSVIDRTKALQPERMLEFQLDELPAAYADRALLELVVTQLIENAIKYTRSRVVAQIRISGEMVGNECRYLVTDNGVGFDMQHASKLFGMFQKAGDPSACEGTGMGLATVQQIIRRHGGRVWAAGAENVGATFGFAVPRMSSDQEARGHVP